MTLDEAVTAYGLQYPASLSVVALNGAIKVQVVAGTQLRGLPDEYEGFDVYYTHNDGTVA